MLRLKNIPNILSGYRLLASPLIFYFIFSGNKAWFILFLSVSLITDILDGLLARTFNWSSEFGARLDSLADIFTFLSAITGMLFLERDFVNAHVFEFSALIILYLIPQLYSLVKFKRTPSLHLYSNKITGYIQGIFIFTFFVFGYAAWYFYFMLVFSILAYLEELYFVLMLGELQSNVKGIFWYKK